MNNVITTAIMMTDFWRNKTYEKNNNINLQNRIIIVTKFIMQAYSFLYYLPRIHDSLNTGIYMIK